jgi:hypothetical protein
MAFRMIVVLSARSGWVPTTMSNPKDAPAKPATSLAISRKEKRCGGWMRDSADGVWPLNERLVAPKDIQAGTGVLSAIVA